MKWIWLVGLGVCVLSGCEYNANALNDHPLAPIGSSGGSAISAPSASGRHVWDPALRSERPGRGVSFRDMVP